VKLKLLDGATATNGVPTAGDVTVGFPLYGIGRTGKSHNVPADGVASLTAVSTAGSGTMTCQLRIWLWVDAITNWAPYGGHATAASRGLINLANAIDEVDANLLSHTELISGLNNYKRIYAQVAAIGGTDTAIDLWIHGR